MHKIIRKLRRAVLRDEPGYYDMYLNEGERFFARLYLHHIREVIRQHAKGPLKLLDAGCQTGRLAVPLAKDGHAVTGVDTSGLALRRASRHAEKEGTTLQTVRADLGVWLPRQPENLYDTVLCAEVLYLRENHRELLRGLLRLLRPGGLAFISHRPPAFYLAEALERQDSPAVQTLRSGAGEGTVCGSYYNWQKREELARIYSEEGMRVLKIVPIWSLAQTLNPEKSSPQERDRLFSEEISAPNENGDDGRYLLVCAQKP